MIAPVAMLFFAPLDAKGLGYALSGGGARGFAQIGILKVLEEEGVYPDQISGTSMGAVIGSLYAMGHSAVEIEQILLSLDINDLMLDRYEREDIYIGQKRWPQYGNITLYMGSDWIPRLPSSLYVGNKLNLTLARLAFSASNCRDFTELPIPFTSVATDLVSGDPVIFDGGSLMQAVRASVSVPSMMI
ncbi:MAG: patatin-like phospholipase family protein, partial [Candidatus Syntrophosphaera sp.]